QLRRMRGLRQGDPDTFDLITQDQILDVFNKLTGAFFLVMLVLSSVALLVGGIGVMAIMMVSVTDRTREIGVRKAMGATRREILWQFLVEAATLTLMGGVLGILLELSMGELLKAALQLEAPAPVGRAVAGDARGPRPRAGPAGRHPPLPHGPASRPPRRGGAGPRRLLPRRPREVRAAGRAPPAVQNPARPRLPRRPGEAVLRG